MRRDETNEQRNARLTAFELDMLPVKRTPETGWQLSDVDSIEWRQDDSGIYCIINYNIDTETVRIDLFMILGDIPLQSFQGNGDDVRKAVMQWLSARISQKAGLGISIEHAAYIGAEICKAEFMTIDYVQD
jgi:hypothetical protein